MASACAGGCSRWGLQLTAAWVAFSLLSNVLWALHLSRLTGWSSLPNYWGELLTARDLMELLENGGLRAHWTGPWVPLAAGLAMCWVLWSGWRLQAAAAGLPARFGPWVWGLADALAIGAAPLAALAGLLLLALGGLAGTGIQGFGWCQWVGGSLVRLAFWSALFLQWWLCRLGRAGAPPGPRLGSWRALFRHLGVSFRRFWLHPLQWLSLVLGGVALRTGLTLLALALAWRLGGGTIPKVCGLLAMELAVVAGTTPRSARSSTSCGPKPPRRKPHDPAPHHGLPLRGGRLRPGDSPSQPGRLDVHLLRAPVGGGQPAGPGGHQPVAAPVPGG
jgi:hypothetical protein